VTSFGSEALRGYRPSQTFGDLQLRRGHPLVVRASIAVRDIFCGSSVWTPNQQPRGRGRSVTSFTESANRGCRSWVPAAVTSLMDLWSPDQRAGQVDAGRPFVTSFRTSQRGKL
jgi:hypothetical protein